MKALVVAALVRLAACLICLGIVAAQGQAPAGNTSTNSRFELINKLTEELGVTPAQATGGAGAIFKFAKSRLSPADFTKVAGSVPGMGGLLKAAPVSKGESTLSALGSFAPEGMGGLASLGSSLKSLGLSPSMVGKFVPVLQNWSKRRVAPASPHCLPAR